YPVPPKRSGLGECHINHEFLDVYAKLANPHILIRM
ncbi:Transposase, IS200/IS605 family, partial [Crocosphaera watsonii WH 0003]